MIRLVGWLKHCNLSLSLSLGAAAGKTAQLMNDEVCAPAAAYSALAALFGMGSSVLLCSRVYLLGLFAHAALVAHRLGGVDHCHE